MLPRRKNSLHFVEQGFSLATGPEGMPYRDDIVRSKQYDALLDDSGGGTPE
jgi:hypothetical protein